MDRNIVKPELISTWHSEEKEWWNKYSEIMNTQWQLTSSSNNKIRNDLYNFIEQKIYKNGAHLLDLGCGSGWLAHRFASKGMKVTGIDFSDEQIQTAKSQYAHENATYICGDILNDYDIQDIKNKKFDRIFINAFLHHLPNIEIKILLEKISSMLAPGGTIFMYEPLFGNPVQNGGLGLFFDKFINKAIVVLLHYTPKFLKAWDSKYQPALSEGYTGLSPHESPIDIDWLSANLPGSVTIEGVRPVHLYSLGFSMQAMLLKKYLSIPYLFIGKSLYYLDKVMLTTFNWKIFSQEKRFIMCCITLKNKS